MSSSIAFLVESAPPRHWGTYGGWHTSTMALGIASDIAVAGVFSAVLSETDMGRWGWRVPFLLALPLGIIGLDIRLRLQETPAFEGAARPDPGRAHASAARTPSAARRLRAAT